MLEGSATLNIFLGGHIFALDISFMEGCAPYEKCVVNWDVALHVVYWDRTFPATGLNSFQWPPERLAFLDTMGTKSGALPKPIGSLANIVYELYFSSFAY